MQLNGHIFQWSVPGSFVVMFFGLFFWGFFWGGWRGDEVGLLVVCFLGFVLFSLDGGFSASAAVEKLHAFAS